MGPEKMGEVQSKNSDKWGQSKNSFDSGENKQGSDRKFYSDPIFQKSDPIFVTPFFKQKTHAETNAYLPPSPGKSINDCHSVPWRHSNRDAHLCRTTNGFRCVPDR